MKKILLSPWTALFTLLLVLGVRFADPSFVESVRLIYFDQLIVSQPSTDIPVSIVSIDEASLDKYGQFPFPRDIYANIIKELYKREAGLVVFNVLMPEADRFKQDGTLARVMSQYPVILPSLAATKEKNKSFGSPVQVVGQDPEGRVVEYPGLISNVPALEEIAAGVGIVNTFPEIDGVLRRMPLVIASQGQLHPALALETLRVAAKDPKVQVKIGDLGVEALRVPKFGKVQTDELSRIWVDWSKRPEEYSLVDLPDSFDGKVVIVGLSAQGLVNPIATARGEVWPHDMQASVLGTMITGTTIQRTGYADTVELAAILVLGILVIFLSRWTYAFIPVVLVLASGHWIASYLFASNLWLYDITAPVVGIGLVYLHAYCQVCK